MKTDDSLIVRKMKLNLFIWDNLMGFPEKETRIHFDAIA